MRQLAFLTVFFLAWVPPLAAAPAWKSSAFWSGQRAPISFGDTGSFGSLPSGHDDTDGLLGGSLAPQPRPEAIELPRLEVGPFHATVSGVGKGLSDFGGDQIDTRDFWRSTVTGSVDARGALVTFTLATP